MKPPKPANLSAQDPTKARARARREQVNLANGFFCEVPHSGLFLYNGHRLTLSLSCEG